MDVAFSEQSDFDPILAVKKLRLDLERRLMSGNELRTASIECFTATPIEKQETREEFLAARRLPLATPNLVHHPRFFCLNKTVKAPYRGRLMSSRIGSALPLQWLRFLNLSNHSLTLIGITVLFFALLCITRGWYSDLSLGYPIFTSGLAMIGVGLVGRFLAK